jgi:hypothetical protein
MMNSDVHYDVTLAIFSDKGQQLATSSTKGVDKLGGAGATGITNAFARKLEVLFDDAKVAAALRT